MDGVATPIIGRPRPLPGHDTPNPAYHPHTLNYEEPPNRPADHTDDSDQATQSSSTQGETLSRSLKTAGDISPLIIKDLETYPQPPTNTYSSKLNSEEVLYLHLAIAHPSTLSREQL